MSEVLRVVLERRRGKNRKSHALARDCQQSFEGARKFPGNPLLLPSDMIHRTMLDSPSHQSRHKVEVTNRPFLLSSNGIVVPVLGATEPKPRFLQRKMIEKKLGDL